MAKANGKYERGGVAFVGCIVLGLGIGMLFDHGGVGAVIGAGIGFLAMALIRER